MVCQNSNGGLNKKKNWVYIQLEIYILLKKKIEIYIKIICKIVRPKSFYSTILWGQIALILYTILGLQQLSPRSGFHSFKKRKKTNVGLMGKINFM